MPNQSYSGSVYGNGVNYFLYTIKNLPFRFSMRNSTHESMKTVKNYLAILAMAFLCSCKKENTEEEPVYPNYGQLKTGNYWIYQRFDVDTLGHATPRNEYDSCYIEKDTLIQGKTYYKLVKPSQPNMPFVEKLYLRDSLHYIVNHHGTIVFSSTDFTGIFTSFYYVHSGTDTIYQAVSKMSDKDVLVNTPSGTYLTSSLKITFNAWPGVYSLGGSQRTVKRSYAQNIGIVSETLYPSFTVPNYIERRLVRYKVD